MNLDVKRLYLPFVVHASCPECGGSTSIRLDRERYLSYPSTDDPYSLEFLCDECGSAWSEEVKLTIALTPCSGCVVVPT